MGGERCYRISAGGLPAVSATTGPGPGWGTSCSMPYLLKDSYIFWTCIYWTNMFVKPVSVLTCNYCRNVAIPYVIAWIFIAVSGARCIYARSARLDLPTQHSLPIRRVRDKFALKVCNLSWSYFPWCCSYYRLSTVTSSLLLRDRIQ